MSPSLKHSKNILLTFYNKTYCTVSTQAIMAIAGFLPAHLIERDRQRRYRDKITKEAAREETNNKWQQKWDAPDTKTGRWTKRMIKNVRKWSTRKHGMVDFYITQMITGHGCFGKYLTKYRRRQNPECVDCGAAEDDVKHTLLVCNWWWRSRDYTYTIYV